MKVYEGISDIWEKIPEAIPGGHVHRSIGVSRTAVQKGKHHASMCLFHDARTVHGDSFCSLHVGRTKNSDPRIERAYQHPWEVLPEA